MKLKRFYSQWTQDCGYGFMECYSVVKAEQEPRTFKEASRAVRASEATRTACSLAFPDSWYVVEIPSELDYLTDEEIGKLAYDAKSEKELREILGYYLREEREADRIIEQLP